MNEISETSSSVSAYEKSLSLLSSFFCGTAAAIVASVIWAAATHFTGYRFGILAIGVGLTVGLTMRLVGRCEGKSILIMAACLSGIGCVCGDLLATYALAAKELDISVLETMSRTSFSAVFSDYKASLDGVSMLIYGFAMYEGYTLSEIQSTLPFLHREKIL